MVEQKESEKSNKILSAVQGEIKKSNVKQGEQAFTVVKRDGRFAPFRQERIFKAIEAAFRDTRGIPKKKSLPRELAEIIQEITNKVTEQAFSLAEKEVILTVEGIQDLVEVTLMKNDHHDVARDYIIYRDKHKELRSDSPRQLKIIRKDAEPPVRFNPMKIARTIERNFRRTYQIEGQAPEHIVEAVNLLTQNVVGAAVSLSKTDEDLHVNHIQDLIEEQLMREGYYDVAKEYILYRSSQGKQTPPSEIGLKKSLAGKSYIFIGAEEKEIKITESHIKAKITYACRGFEEIASVEELYEQVLMNFYEGMKIKELDTAMAMAAKANIEKDPIYSQIAARLLLDALYRETMGVSANDPTLEKQHHSYFKAYFKRGVDVDRVSPQLLEFDLDKLADAIELDRDDQFQYLGLQTLYDRYFLHHEEVRMETPQIFWMRVAMGLAINEENKNEKAIEFYHTLSEFYFTSATPTLFNSGTVHSQLSSCYLSTVMDDLSHIFKIISDDAQLSKWAGGLGNDWTNVRATGSLIKGTNGQSQGIIPFLKSCQ